MSYKYKIFEHHDRELYIGIDVDNELEISMDNEDYVSLSTWLTKEQALELAEFIIEGYKDE